LGYGEHLVGNAFIFSFLSVIALLLLPLYAAVNGSDFFVYAWFGSMIPMILYQAWATYGAYASPERRIGDAARAVIAAIVYQLSGNALQSLMAGVYIGIKGASNA